MVLKNDYEIANVVSRALYAYANKVETGQVGAYMELLEKDAVTVTLTITEIGGLTVEAKPKEPEPAKAEPILPFSEIYEKAKEEPT